FVPGSRKLAVLVADLLEPGFAVGDQPAANRPGHADPFAVNIIDDPRQVVIAALFLADRLRDVGDVGEALDVEPRPVVDDHDDVGAGAGLYRRGDARLDVVGIDGYEAGLAAEVGLGFRPG